ncbi:MAG TPA: putative DNA binding domain-containing protein, partial [Melioribacteraceae bacterium]|nr:putative DNA binding domain-containing protein [Melioribacteraceae bacterium]
MKIIDKIKIPEGRNLEFKETIPEKDSIAKTAVAFSNDGGGEIFIGIKNSPRIITGINENDLLLYEEKITNIINDNCFPTILVDIVSAKIEEKYLLIVKIPKGSLPPYFLKSYGKENGTFIRVGSSNRQASPEILQEIERKRLNISYDSLPIYEIELDKIDLSLFSKTFSKITGKKVNKISLEKLGLIKKEGTRYFATNSGILFSNSDIKKAVFPYAKVECARFKGLKTDTIIDFKTIEESVFLQAEKVIAFIERNINKGSTIGKVYREEKWEYPISAIREIVINAIVHRDYSLTGKDIKVAIFDDMLEITSPGTIPPSIDLNDLSSGQSEIRNKTIAPIFKELKLIEQWGTGFQKLFDSLKEYPNLEIKINQPALSFQVQLIKKDYGFIEVSKNTNHGVEKYPPSTPQVPPKYPPSTPQVVLDLKN